MTKPNKAIAATDADGAAIYFVPTSKGRWVKVSAKSLSKIGTGPFYWNKSGNGFEYVRCMGLDNNVSLARLIANAGPGTVVHHRDGDRANLRDDNLIVARGSAKRRDRAMMRLRADASAAAILLARLQAVADRMARDLGVTTH